MARVSILILLLSVRLRWGTRTKLWVLTSWDLFAFWDKDCATRQIEWRWSSYRSCWRATSIKWSKGSKTSETSHSSRLHLLLNLRLTSESLGWSKWLQLLGRLIILKLLLLALWCSTSKRREILSLVVEGLLLLIPGVLVKHSLVIEVVVTWHVCNAFVVDLLESSTFYYLYYLI